MLRSKWHHHCCSRALLLRFLSSASLFPTTTAGQPQFFTELPSYHRYAHFRSRGAKLPDAPPISDSTMTEDGEESDSDTKKSRNGKKREARRAVRWGMELAAFSDSQIKRILRVLALEEEVFDALKLVKRFGRDVREGRRRQFNYIGRLLREVEPDLMDSLILATKEGDRGKFERLFGPESWVIANKDEAAEESESEDEEEFNQGSKDYLDVASRWFDGLINKDVDVTKEIYSLSSVEFDRQELRGLVRKFSSVKKRQVTSQENEGEVDKAFQTAERSLTRFLRALARQLPTE